MFDIEKGTIVTVIKEIYIDFPGGLYKDHFVEKKLHYIALEMPSNNGNFLSKDKFGRLCCMTVNEVVSVK